MEFTAEMIAAGLGGEIVGNKDVKVNSFAKIEEGVEGALSFFSNPKYEQYIYTTLSSIIIVNRSFEPSQECKATLIKVDDAYGSFAKLLEMYVSHKPQKIGVHPTAAIDSTAEIGKDCYIGAYAVIESGVKVGKGSKIYPHVYLGDRVKIGENSTLFSGVNVYEECVVGDNVIIHSGTVVGNDGFGFAPDGKGGFSKIPQIGNVVIGDDVEIGSNCSIDRATMGSTVIKKGTKLDNQIHIAHNVEIGENTVIAAQTGIAGSTKMGRNCIVAGKVGIVGHLTIGDRVIIGSNSGVGKDIADGETVMGSPSMPVSKYRRVNATISNILEMRNDLIDLQKQVKQMKGESKKE